MPVSKGNVKDLLDKFDLIIWYSIKQFRIEKHKADHIFNIRIYYKE